LSRKGGEGGRGPLSPNIYNLERTGEGKGKKGGRREEKKQRKEEEKYICTNFPPEIFPTFWEKASRNGEGREEVGGKRTTRTKSSRSYTQSLPGSIRRKRDGKNRKGKKEKGGDIPETGLFLL